MSHEVVPASITLRSFIVFNTLLYVRFDRNKVIHSDLKTSSVHEKIKKFGNKHANTLELHTNAVAKQLLNNSRDIEHFKLLKPYDLI